MIMEVIRLALSIITLMVTLYSLVLLSDINRALTQTRTKPAGVYVVPGQRGQDGQDGVGVDGGIGGKGGKGGEGGEVRWLGGGVAGNPRP